MTDLPLTPFRFRIWYARKDELRYVGHLDMQLVWERTIRRARIPVAFSQGFSPRPRFHMAAALPLGFTSTGEIADIWLTESIAPEDLVARLQTAAPPGLIIREAAEVPLRWPALQTQVVQAVYKVHLLGDLPQGTIQTSVQTLLAADSLIRTWRKKTYDLRPLIDSIVVCRSAHAPNDIDLHLLLSAREGATARPEEVLSAMGIDPLRAKIHRERLILKPVSTEDL